MDPVMHQEKILLDLIFPNNHIIHSFHYIIIWVLYLLEAETSNFFLRRQYV